MPETFRARDAWTNFIGLAGLIAILAVAFYLFDIDEMRLRIEQAGIWAPLLFIFAKASTIVVAPLGGSPLYPIAGALFGFWKGMVLLVLGDALGGTISFFLSRYFGRKLVERLIGNEGMVASALEMMGTVKGFFIARVCLAAFPELASYAAGLTKLHFAPFIIIYTLIGIAPALVGVSIGTLLAEGRDGYVLGFAALLAGVLTVGGMGVFGWYAQKKKRDEIGATEPPLPPSVPSAF